MATTDPTNGGGGTSGTPEESHELISSSKDEEDPDTPATKATKSMSIDELHASSPAQDDSETLLEKGERVDDYVIESATEDPVFESTMLDEVQLTENVYSIMYAAKFASPAFLFATFVFIFQMTIIGLILWDLMGHYNRSSNPFDVPPGNRVEVLVGQALALLLAVAVQGDIIAAVVMLQRGYDRRVLLQCRHATHTKWFMACFLQLCAGGGLLITIFTLVMQSSTVINMFLNFAALAFISEIDDVAFALAKNGFLSEELEEEANVVAGLKVPSQKTSKKLRCVLFFLIFSGLMAGYAVLVRQQQRGVFLCQSLFVQIGDGFAPEASTFSGFYDQTDFLRNGKVTYLERRSKKAMLGYCDKENAWTMTIWLQEEEESGQEGYDDPCDWQYRSKRTESFDITTTSDTPWLISLDRAGIQPFQYFELGCADCGGDGVFCSGNGKCQDNQCVCDSGFYGMNCRFTEPCPSLAVDARTTSFPPGFSYFNVSNNYELLLDDSGAIVPAYEKPVYVYDHGDYWSVIMFTGRRWITTSTEPFDRVANTTISANATKQELIGFIENYHAFFDPIPAYFVSDPMDIGTPSDGLTPVGFGWFQTKSNSLEGLLMRKVDTSQAIATSLLCTVCDERDNDCFAGNCTEGVCNCYEGIEGVLCELTPDATGTRV